MFSESSGLRENVPKFTVLITTGKSDDDIIPGSEKLKSKSTLLIVGIKELDKESLDQIASDPVDELAIYAENNAALFELAGPITKIICESSVRENPCQTENGLQCDVNADCVSGEEAFDCICRQGYEGDGYTCEGIFYPNLSPLIQLDHTSLSVHNFFYRY